MRVTIVDVAARAGVSKTTVSRVLNNRGDVDQRTARRVRDVIELLGYVPSAGAVGLAVGRTNTIAMLIPSLGWPWMSEIVQGVADTAEAQRYALQLHTCTRGKESLDLFMAGVAANSCDGLVVVIPENGLVHISALHERGLPLVMIDDRSKWPGLPTVVCANRRGGESAAGHLLQIGRSSPIVVTGPRRYECVQQRLAGFKEAMFAAGHRLPEEQIIDGDFTVADGRAAIAAVSRTGHRFDAVFAMNDLAATGVLAGLRASGRRVPDDVAVIGFDDVALAAHTDPPLTTIHQPMREMGATAARLLLGALGGTPVGGERTVLDTRLVVRGSTVAG